ERTADLVPDDPAVVLRDERHDEVLVVRRADRAERTVERLAAHRVPLSGSVRVVPVAHDEGLDDRSMVLGEDGPERLGGRRRLSRVTRTAGADEERLDHRELATVGGRDR